MKPEEVIKYSAIVAIVMALAAGYCFDMKAVASMLFVLAAYLIGVLRGIELSDTASGEPK